MGWQRVPRTGVLLLQLFQALRVVGLEASVLVTPPVVRLLGHSKLPAYRRDILTVGEHPVGLPELADDLLRGVTLPAVRHDLTSLPARNRGRQDDSHNHRTYKTGSAHSLETREPLSLSVGLNVVYGLNGAGKSRLLRAIRSVLLGIEGDTMIALVIRTHPSDRSTTAGDYRERREAEERSKGQAEVYCGYNFLQNSSSCTLVAADVAPTSQLSQTWSTIGGITTISFHAAAKNPLEPFAPAIDGTMNLLLTSRAWRVYGTHDRMPVHHFWWAYSGTEGTLAYMSEPNGYHLHCLFGTPGCVAQVNLNL